MSERPPHSSYIPLSRSGEPRRYAQSSQHFARRAIGPSCTCNCSMLKSGSQQVQPRGPSLAAPSQHGTKPSGTPSQPGSPSGLKPPAAPRTCSALTAHLEALDPHIPTRRHKPSATLPHTLRHMPHPKPRLRRARTQHNRRLHTLTVRGMQNMRVRDHLPPKTSKPRQRTGEMSQATASREHRGRRQASQRPEFPVQFLSLGGLSHMGAPLGSISSHLLGMDAAAL